MFQGQASCHQTSQRGGQNHVLSLSLTHQVMPAQEAGFNTSCKINKQLSIALKHIFNSTITKLQKVLKPVKDG